MKVILVAIVGIIVTGCVLSQLWAWFVVPIGAPDIAVADAIGISIVAQILTGQHATRISQLSQKTSDEILGETLSADIVHPIAALGVGWIVKLFV